MWDDFYTFWYVAMTIKVSCEFSHIPLGSGVDAYTGVYHK